ncbi:PH domain-containing protein [Flindersiella endophytica]
MGISAKALGQDEEVILELRTHWKALFWPAVVLVLVVAIAAAGVTFMPTGEYQQYLQLGVVALAVIVLFIWVVWPWLNWFSATYVVTNQRLITRRGVLTRTGRDIPLGRINDVSHERQLSDRILGCGTLVIWSAGEQGRVELHDVPRVEEVQRTISELLFSKDGVNDDDPPAQQRG